MRRGWPTLRAGAATTAVVVGALALLEGVFNLTEVVHVTANVLLWVAMGLTYAFVIARVDIGKADHETRTVTAGRRVRGSRAAKWLRFLVLLAMFEVVQAIRSRSPNGPVLLSLPGWVLALVGLALTAASLWELFSRSDRIVDPRRSSTP